MLRQGDADQGAEASRVRRLDRLPGILPGDDVASSLALAHRAGSGKPAADLLLVNATVITLDPSRPTADALAVRNGRIAAVGSWAELRSYRGRGTQLIDAGGAIAVPAFHDAHCHLLSYARSRSWLNLRAARSMADVRAAVAAHAAQMPAGAWVRAFGYDETILAGGRHPDRHDLDAVAPDRPVRLQHRSLHVDVLNTMALRLVGLMDARPGVERDSATGEPTGRLYSAAELLRAHVPHGAVDDLAADVRRASEELLAEGVTTVQDASVTNGLGQWELFHRLSRSGDLGVRVIMMAGAAHWRELAGHGSSPPVGDTPVTSPRRPHACPPRVRLGPVKFMLDEATSDPAEVRARVAAARRAGRPVALHAVSEAEVAIAMHALRGASRRERGIPDRIEHGAMIPDAWLPELRALGIAVVGQPTLVYERGDFYRSAYPPETHGWIHRARSLLAAGITYAASSDAPVTDPSPTLGLFAATRRITPTGAVLGPQERLGAIEALEAFTLAPARVGGMAHELGRLRVGALADIAVIDRETLHMASADAPPVRMTIMEGNVVWCA